MKKKVRSILIVTGVSIALFFAVGGHFIHKYYHKKVRSKPKMYCYQTYYGPPNPVLIIESRRYKDSYIKYYNKVSKGANPFINFPLKTLPVTHPVHVMGYTEDSTLADVVSYFHRGPKRGGRYTRGWVYADCLHKNPPPKKQDQ